MAHHTNSSSPRAVVHLVDTLYPFGTERQMMEQLRRLDRRRWRPLVASLHSDGPLREELMALALPHQAFPLHTHLGHPNTLLQVARLAYWCRSEGAVLVHAHDFYSNVIGLMAGRLTGARVIASRRDLAHWLSPSKQRFLSWVCRAADRVVANAEAVVEHTVQELGVPRERVTLIPNGLDLERFDAEMRLEPAPPLDLATRPEDGGEAEAEDAPVVAVVANMHLPAKGHGDLLAAVALLRERGRRVQVLLVGDGAERPRIEQTVTQLGLADSVRFLSRRDDVPRILARVDLLCLPSWAEGFPNAVMEGMAASLPVVVTAVGGCPELVAHGENGFVVPPREPPALAEAIERILFGMGRKAARAMGR
ncbi:MAG TPA: glycosyltransferase, partial [Polyangia bacterium]|nr:glycosyltransferase [Polyangia bacterium]